MGKKNRRPNIKSQGTAVFPETPCEMAKKAYFLKTTWLHKQGTIDAQAYQTRAGFGTDIEKRYKNDRLKHQ